MSQMKHIPALDGVRGLAVLQVMLLHWAGGAHSPLLPVYVTGEVIKAGWTGVTLFFILSGFLITGILWDSRDAPHWWKNFYARRSLRIFPLYYGTLLVVVLLAAVMGQLRTCLATIWIYVLYLSSFLGTPPVGVPLQLTHFWSLAVEEQFYLIWPLLLIRARSLGQMRIICMAVFLLSAAFRVAVWFDPSSPLHWGGALASRSGELAMGAYLAMAYREPALWQRLRRAAPYILAVSLIGFTAVAYRAGDAGSDHVLNVTFGLPFATFLFGSMLVLSLEPGVFSRFFTNPVLRWFGTISYGLYVYHVLFTEQYIWLARHLAPHAGRTAELLLQAFIALALSTLIALLSYHFIEMPFLSLRRRFSSRGPAAPPVRFAPAGAVSDTGSSGQTE